MSRFISRRLILAVAGGAAVAYAVYRWTGKRGEHLHFQPLQALRTRVRDKWVAVNVTKLNDAEVRRGLQGALTIIPSSVPKSHSHGEAASERNAATEMMQAAVMAVGCEPFHWSPSKREAGELARRSYYTLADLQQAPKWDAIGERAIIVMTDVDYYVNMPQLISLGRPILLYTFHPESVAGNVKNGFFTIDERNYVHYRVTGGKDVQHQIWDYNQDTVYVPQYCHTIRQFFVGNLCHILGLTAVPGAVVCHIDKHSLSPHRSIVSIVPFARVGPGIVSDAMGGELKRMVYYDRGSGFLKLNYIKSDGPTVSIGLPKQLGHATLPLAEFESSVLGHNMTKANLLADTVRRAKGISHSEAIVLHAYLQVAGGKRPAEVHQPGKLAPHFEAYIRGQDNPYAATKEYAREYAPCPVSQSALFPVMSENNDRSCLDGRITKPQAKAKSTLNIGQRHYRWAREFVRYLVPDSLAYTGVPWTVQAVTEKQDKPLQRARTEKHEFDTEVHNMFIMAFQKKEAYEVANNPRNISTCPTPHVLSLSTFTYAFKDDVLKSTGWYIPCLTPAAIAERMQELAQQHESLIETDANRFDGSLTLFLRVYVELAAYLRWSARAYSADLRRLIEAEHNCAARNATQRYSTAYTRASGSPLTTDGNSMINAYASYCMERAAGEGPEVAWSRIGLVAGDDGVRPGTVTSACVSKVTADLGLSYKVERVAHRGEPIAILSRVFLDPWTTPASIQSPRRSLTKLHTTTDRSIEINEIGYIRTGAYLVTDGKTPFISHWCRAYHRNLIAVFKNRAKLDQCTDLPYWVRHSECLTEPWPQEECAAAWDYVAQDIGVTAGELQDHCNQLDAYNGDVSSLPVLQITHKEHKIPAIVEGEIMAGPIQPGPTDEPAISAAIVTPTVAIERGENVGKQRSQVQRGRGRGRGGARNGTPRNQSRPGGGEARGPARGPVEKGTRGSRPAGRGQGRGGSAPRLGGGVVEAWH